MFEVILVEISEKEVEKGAGKKGGDSDGKGRGKTYPRTPASSRPTAARIWNKG